MISKYKLISNLNTFSNYVLPYSRSIVYPIGGTGDGVRCEVNPLGNMFIHKRETKEVAIENI